MSDKYWLIYFKLMKTIIFIILIYRFFYIFMHFVISAIFGHFCCYWITVWKIIVVYYVWYIECKLIILWLYRHKLDVYCLLLPQIFISCYIVALLRTLLLFWVISSLYNLFIYLLIAQRHMHFYTVYTETRWRSWK